MEEASPMNFDTYQLDSTVYDWRLAGGKVGSREGRGTGRTQRKGNGIQGMSALRYL